MASQQRNFQAVSYATLSSSIPWNIRLFTSRYTHKPLGGCVYLEDTSEKWDIPWYTTRKPCITILYHGGQHHATYALLFLGFALQQKDQHLDQSSVFCC